MGNWIDVKRSDGGTFKAYQAQPSGTSAGTVIVIQEIFGVNDHIRSVCDRFAAEGYTAVAPAVFDRVEPNVELNYDAEGIEKGKELMMKVGLEPALDDMRATLDTLGSKSGETAVVGYCWGGTLAFASATRLGDRLACAIAYYGGGIGNLVNEKPKCPVMFHFGKNDQTIPMDVVEKVRQAFPELPVYVYEAGHGFNCDARGSYDAESAKLANQRTLEFLREHVKAG